MIVLPHVKGDGNTTYGTWMRVARASIRPRASLHVIIRPHASFARASIRPRASLHVRIFGADKHLHCPQPQHHHNKITMKLFAILFLLVGSAAAFAPLSPVAFAARTSSTASTFCLEMSRIGNWIRHRRAKRKERREERMLEELTEDFSDDAVIIFGEPGVPEFMNVTEYLAAEENLFASFPHLTIDAEEAELSDLEGDGVKIINTVVSGTFVGEDYVYGDNAAIVANGMTVSKDTIYELLVEDGLITNMVIIGASPDFFYETVAATLAED